MNVLLLNIVENMMTQGEIARFEQFLLLSTCFQKAVCALIDEGQLSMQDDANRREALAASMNDRGDVDNVRDTR